MNTLLMDEIEPAVAPGGPQTLRLAIDPGVSASSQVGSGVCIRGEIHGQQDLFIDGEVNGSIALPGHTLILGPKANVKAGVKARNVIVVGTVEGKIEATERIELRNRCRVLGEIRSPRLMVEAGAYLQGTIEVLR